MTDEELQAHDCDAVTSSCRPMAEGSVVHHLDLAINYQWIESADD